MNIETLEPRIAPASVSVGYTDIDGDFVKITAKLPGAAIAPLDAGDLAFVGGGGGQLATLTLTETGFDGASIVFTVTKKTGGDGFAHVGFIDASVDLDRVVVKGDLGGINAGAFSTPGDPGLNLLKVRSMGTLGLVTQGGPGFPNSTIVGRLGALIVAGDFTDASLFASGIGTIFIGGDLVGGNDVATGRIESTLAIGDVRIGGDVVGGAGGSSGRVHSTVAIGNVRIGGDLIGGGANDSGTIGSGGAMGDVRIGGSIAGGAGSFSGRVASLGAMGNVRIGGDIIGGAGGNTGAVFSIGDLGDVRIARSIIGGGGGGGGVLVSGSDMGDVRIGGDLIGGAGVSSGSVESINMGDMRIGGSIIGGAGSVSGRVASEGATGHVRIGGDVIGGKVAGSVALNDSGEIRGRNIASVTIDGSLIAGFATSTGMLERSGAIIAYEALGPVKIKGSIVGNVTHSATIMAEGQSASSDDGFDTAIASVKVGGDVRFAQILAGFNVIQQPVNADAAIGPVSVGRSWIASSLVAGAQDSGADGFGVNDARQSGGASRLIARIASIAIKGDVTGTLATGDHFGFVAERIDKLKIGARTFSLAPGALSPADNFAIPFTDDVRLLEV